MTYTLDDLISIMALLRSENGCPWDREQTHESIRGNFIEEAYEAAEAIDTHDPALLREELGDVLLQIVFHARIAEEAGEFCFGDVADEICRKLIVRHPHVFGDTKVRDSGEVLENWDAIKRSTKEYATLPEELRGVSKALPSLTRAAKLAGKAAKAGAYSPPDADLSGIGARLFELAAAAKLCGIDPEAALHAECERFIALCEQK